MCDVRAAGAAAVLLVLAVTAAARPSDELDLKQNLLQGQLTADSFGPDYYEEGEEDIEYRELKSKGTVVAREASEEANTQHVPVKPRNPYAVLFGRTCGGTIISPTWIITAGHCTIFVSGSSVLAGTNNTRNGSGVTRHVKRLIIHPLFSVGPYWLNADEFGINQVAARWDFLLVELTEPLPLDGITIAAATLDDSTSTIPGLDLEFAGFGASVHGETMQQTIHHRELTAVPDDICQQKLPEFNPRDMICSKGRPPRYDTACNGDSGSGLVADGKLYGVLSWVEQDARTCRNGLIIVSSRVAAVRDWIRQVTKI